MQIPARGRRGVRDPQILINASKRNCTYLSFRLFVTLAPQNRECTIAQKITEMVGLESLPIIHPLNKVHARRGEVFFINGIICRIQNGLDNINCFSNVLFESRILSLFVKLLQTHC